MKNSEEWQLFRSLLKKKLREEFNKKFSKMEIDKIVMHVWETIEKDFPKRDCYEIDPEVLAGKIQSLANTHRIWFKNEMDWLLMDEAERLESKSKLLLPPEYHPGFLIWAKEVSEVAPGLKAKDVILALSRKVNYTMTARHMTRLANKIKTTNRQDSK